MNPILIGENISKYFGEDNEKLIALDEVSVSVNKGEFVAVMGPSGSGKSTLMFALSSMDSVEKGKVIFGNKELSSMTENELSDIRRTKMGFVFQQPTLLKNLNILDNIILPSYRDGAKERKSLTKKAKELMRETGINGLEKRYSTQVSGGQLQRAGICRALMSEPEIIFADEPTGALNSKASSEIMDIFARINQKGTAIMLVTHDAKVAARAKRVLFMKDGKIVDELVLSDHTKSGIEKNTELISETMLKIEI